jgi:hypothetical protein
MYMGEIALSSRMIFRVLKVLSGNPDSFYFKFLPSTFLHIKINPMRKLGNLCEGFTTKGLRTFST